MGSGSRGSDAGCHALTGVLGDLGALAGPALAGGMAAATSPVIAFAVRVAVVAGAALILTVNATPNAHPQRRAATGLRRRSLLLSSPGLQTLVLSDAGLGLALGAVEVAVPALCARHHSASLAAVPLSVSAAGSVLASLLSGTGWLRRSAAWRYIAGAWIAAVVLAALLATRSVAGITCVLAVACAGVGLLNVALYELLDHVVPIDRAVEDFTWLTTGQAAGMAAGAAAAGGLAGHEIGAAFALPAAAALASAVLVAARAGTLRGRLQTSDGDGS